MTIHHSDEPNNTVAMGFLKGKVHEIEIAEWHPLLDGQGKPTQLHVTLRIDGVDLPIVTRFKEPGTRDNCIEALASHLYSVWPNQWPK